MRIDLNSELLPSESTQSVKTGAKVGAAAMASAPSGEAAEPSSQLLSAAALTAAVSQFPEVRQEKVAALAEQLRAGTYDLSPQKTAEAMLAQIRAA